MSYLQSIPDEIFMLIVSYLNKKGLDNIRRLIDKINWLQLITFRFPKVYRPLILEYNLESIYYGMLYHERKGSLGRFDYDRLYLDLAKYLFLTDQDIPSHFQIAKLDDVNLYLKFKDLNGWFDCYYFPESPNIMKYFLDQKMANEANYRHSVEYDVISLEVANLFLNKFGINLSNISIIMSIWRFELSEEMENRCWGWLTDTFEDDSDKKLLIRMLGRYRPETDNSPLKGKRRKIYERYKHYLD